MPKPGTYHEIFLQSPIARMLFAISEDNVFSLTEINNAASEYFGIDREISINKDIREVFDPVKSEHFKQAFQTCIKNSQPATINALPKLPDSLNVQAFILNPIFDEANKISLIDVVAKPITADSGYLKRERDDALQLLTSLFDATGMGIIITDHLGNIMRVNNTFLDNFGWRKDDLLGEDFTTIIPAEEYKTAKKRYNSFIKKGQQEEIEARIIHKDGSIANVFLTTTLLELSQKRKFMVSTIRDITDQKAIISQLRIARNKAKSANKAKSTFLASMSRELSNPLNAIIALSELIRDESKPSGKAKEYLVDILHSARYTMDLINDVLNIAKIEAGNITLSESNVDINEMFEQVSIIMEEFAKDASIKIRTELEGDLDLICVDKRLIEQALINIVANAIKFSSHGGEITMRAYALNNGYIRLSVEDKGRGINKNKIREITEPFVNIEENNNLDVSLKDHSLKRETGMGLPMAKSIVELHTAKLSIDSREAVGTKVYIDIPPSRVICYTGDRLK